MISGSRSQGRENPLYHPAFAHDPLREEVQTYANWGLAWSTNRMYGSGEKHFNRFCVMNRITFNGGDILPATEGTLIYFASYLARTVKHSIIELYLSAVRQPLTPGVLLAIQPILHTWLGEWYFLMIWTAFTLAFYAFLQCSGFTYQGAVKFHPQYHFTRVWLARSRCQFFLRPLIMTHFIDRKTMEKITIC